MKITFLGAAVLFGLGMLLYQLFIREKQKNPYKSGFEQDRFGVNDGLW